MDSALATLGISPTPYTDLNLSGLVIRAVHLLELQQRTDSTGDGR